MLKLRKSKEQKAITLIALIITIVVLLILAAVAISSIQENGILGYAQNAADSWNKAAQNEVNMLGDYLNYLNNMGSGNGGGDIDVTDDATMSAKTTNTKIEDIYGNKITIPAGFKISVENTGYTKDTLDVTKGIVIEDVTKDASGNPTSTTGNQFVWIPCGTINHLDENGEETTSTITLGRYSSFTATNGVYTPAQTAENYATETKINTYYTEDISSSKDNAEARNLEAFITSVIGNDSKEGNGGYYIGRYEAGDSNSETVAKRTGTDGTSTEGTLVCKANQVPYNYIFQPDASSKCQNMYPDGYKADGTGTFSSDLINSYAWDTAIIFIQTFGTKSNSATYASTNGESSMDTSAPQLTGVNRLLNVTNNPIDEQLNIYDMAGNCREWTTETCSYSPDYPCVYRGGTYGGSLSFTSYRDTNSTTYSFSSFAFRPLIYVGL